jgi:hypothetical protein
VKADKKDTGRISILIIAVFFLSIFGLLLFSSGIYGFFYLDHKSWIEASVPFIPIVLSIMSFKLVLRCFRLLMRLVQK